MGGGEPLAQFQHLHVQFALLLLALDVVGLQQRLQRLGAQLVEQRPKLDPGLFKNNNKKLIRTGTQSPESK